ncbi:hypothetical protein ACU7M1_01940 [Burkholderia pseudomallei]|uniref:hypothetical protein n=1 Tax=Burkholderia pseudomallei TaxID=28450 RepID=UPI00406C71E2
MISMHGEPIDIAFRKPQAASRKPQAASRKPFSRNIDARHIFTVPTAATSRSLRSFPAFRKYIALRIGTCAPPRTPTLARRIIA